VFKKEGICTYMRRLPPPVSPNVVASTLMIQNPRVTSGTLLNVPADSFVMWESLSSRERNSARFEEQSRLLFIVQSIFASLASFLPLKAKAG
jgi:hypothetical protein